MKALIAILRVASNCSMGDFRIYGISNERLAKPLVKFLS